VEKAVEKTMTAACVFIGCRQEDILSMQWNRSTAIGLASASCTLCHGDGMRIVHKTRETPCNCVFRSIFRACYNRFRECVALGDQTKAVSLEYGRGCRPGGHTYSRKREEFLADFCLVSRRVLEDSEYHIFRYFFLLGADWKLCCRQLKIDRGTFFHQVYRVEQILGREFAELEPYALYPLNEYFGGVVKKEAVRPISVQPIRTRPEPRFPLRLSA
jgi:hypothetical protein